MPRDDPAATAPRAGLGDFAPAAAAIAAIVYVATLFRTNERDLTYTIPSWQTFAQAANIALLPAIVLFVLLLGAGVLGAFRRWWSAAIAGLVCGAIAEMAGHLVQIVSNDLDLGGEAWAAILGETIGTGWPFVSASLVVTAIAAPIIVAPRQPRAAVAAAAQTSVARPAGEGQGTAYVRVPPDALAARASATEREQGEDAGERLAAEWEAFVDVLDAHGWETFEVPRADADPGSAFVADTAVIFGDQAIIARFADADRAAEPTAVRDTLAERGGVIEELDASARFDAADALAGTGTLYLGAGEGTNAAAVRAIRRMAAVRGLACVVIELHAGFRLSEVAGVLPDGTLAVWTPALVDPDAIGRHLAVSEQRGAAIVVLDAETIAVSASARETAKRYERLGFAVERIGLEAFEDVGGSLPRLALLARL